MNDNDNDEPQELTKEQRSAASVAVLFYSIAFALLLTYSTTLAFAWLSWRIAHAIREDYFE